MLFRGFRLPRLRPNHRNQGAARRPDPVRIRPNPGTRVLVVDDSKTTQAVLNKKLSRQGYEVLTAFNGEDGVALARAERPHLVLMDVVMPGIDGFRATRLLRRDPDPAVANMAIVIMSGNAQATEQFWSSKIGADEFLAKPFSDERLFAHIERLLFPGASEDDAVGSLAEG